MTTSSRLISTAAFISLIFLTACGGGGDSKSSPWVGSWLLQTINGRDVSDLRLIYIFTETKLHVDATGYNCTSDNDFSSDGVTFHSVITGGDCPGTVIGKTSSGTIAFEGNSMTIHETEYGGAPSNVLDVFTRM
ncbi:MAG: hypothetical protein OEY50_04785 [Nitrospinota bacterium]|nr:hypothetical protein [Nitrospinota bacterium]MDH5678169.1 hypothetical protein [Nitrospinota bacterium]MDH5755846.1 hypothetical protein [Nitrospinota bacterium]